MRVYQTKSCREYKKYYLDEAQFAIGSVWTDIVNLSKGQHEQTGYPTQKPIELLKRIIQASCPQNGIILDAFMGSGTTCEAAEQFAHELNCTWIGIDNSKFAIH